MTASAGPFERLRLALQRTVLLRLRTLANHTDRLRRRRPTAPHLATGLRGEFEALFLLRRLGYVVVERRWRTSGLNGDLDLIAWEGNTLCFIEVKARTQRDLYPAAYAVDPEKERMLRRMARAYLRTLPAVERYSVVRRFDVVSIYLVGGVVDCELKRGAFDAEEANSRLSGVQRYGGSHPKEKPMALLNAPEYDSRKENLIRNLLVGSGITFVLLVLLTLAGYISGHGWLFTNLPAEHKINRFFNALEAKDYGTAFAIYTNDADWKQHPAAHTDYPLDRFTEDWTTQSPVKGPITSHHVDISRTDGTGTFGTGTIVAVRVNGDNKLFMWVNRADGTITEPAPHEILY